MFFYFPFVQALKFLKMKRVKKKPFSLPDWSVYSPKTHLLMSCQMLQVSTSPAASAMSASWLPLGPHCGVQAVKKMGHCPRLSPLNPYASPLLINLLRLHCVPQGHSACVCVILSFIFSTQSGQSNCPTFDPSQMATSRHKSCQPTPVWAYAYTNSWKKFMSVPGQHDI